MKKDSGVMPTPQWGATMALLACLAITPVVAKGSTPELVAHEYAIGIGLGLAISLLIDYRRNLRNLVRADLMALASLYFLTLFEFLLPQPDFNELVTLEETIPALSACLVGFAGLAIGRHLAPYPPASVQKLLRDDFPPRAFLIIYTIALIGGYFYMLLAVDGDFLRMIDYFMMPRFSQPWGRGKFGDWKALVAEIGMMLYLVPPVAGIIIATRKNYTASQFTYVILTFAFTLFYGFTSGTRNIFAAYLATFIVAYAFSYRKQRRTELVAVGAIVAAMMLLATTMMLEFRNVGFKVYLDGYRENRGQKTETNFFVDYNLYVVAKLATVFPSQHEYLGFEIPYLAIIRPIPRAMWSGKPEGISLSIEEAVGVEGLTLASSFVGEAFMSGGIVGVMLTALAFGAITGWWNRLGRSDNSPFGHLVFASGFFAAVISMRSMFVFTTAILPTIAALVLGNALLTRRKPRQQTAEPDA